MKRCGINVICREEFSMYPNLHQVSNKICMVYYTWYTMYNVWCILGYPQFNHLYHFVYTANHRFLYLLSFILSLSLSHSFFFCLSVSHSRSVSLSVFLSCVLRLLQNNLIVVNRYIQYLLIV